MALPERLMGWLSSRWIVPTSTRSYSTLYQITARLIIVQADFFAAFTFAHRARCAAAILLRALADIGRFRILDYGPKMYVAPGP
jgi:hypothetical protein